MLLQASIKTFLGKSLATNKASGHTELHRLMLGSTSVMEVQFLEKESENTNPIILSRNNLQNA